ncbi:MAG: Crp/Fnr family transcriptional regulator [Paracoccaceae bacterium]
MELTLEAALSGDSVLGHIAYVFLIASMLMSTLLWLRILVILSAILAVLYAVLILQDPVSMFWEALLVIVNVAQILRVHWRSLRARFTEVEAAFVADHLPGLTRGDARALLDKGVWHSADVGDILATQGAPITHLHYVATGKADVINNDTRVAECRPGSFVGEMTVLTGGPATATVQVCESAMLWQVRADVLRKVLAGRDPSAAELEAAFARNYRTKLAQMNAQHTGRASAG